MNSSVRSCLIAGVAVVTAGFPAVVLPVTPYGSGIASAQPADSTDGPGPAAGSGSRGADRNEAGTGTNAVAGQANRGSQVTGNRQTSSASGQVAVYPRSRSTTAPGLGNDVQSFGASGNRVTFAANGSIRPQTQPVTTREAATVSATAASAPDSSSTPSTGRTINAAVQRALAGQQSATAHASGGTSETVSTEQATIGAAQAARSSSPYAGNRNR
jgi:hypothetical protein